MMDYEVLKTKNGAKVELNEYVMQVNSKFFRIPFEHRNKNRIKLMDLHSKGEFKPVQQDNTLRINK